MGVMSTPTTWRYLDVLGHVDGREGTEPDQTTRTNKAKTNIQSTPKCGDCGLDLPGIPALRPRECES